MRRNKATWCDVNTSIGYGRYSCKREALSPANDVIARDDNGALCRRCPPVQCVYICMVHPSTAQAPRHNLVRKIGDKTKQTFRDTVIVDAILAKYLLCKG